MQPCSPEIRARLCSSAWWRLTDTGAVPPKTGRLLRRPAIMMTPQRIRNDRYERRQDAEREHQEDVDAEAAGSGGQHCTPELLPRSHEGRCRRNQEAQVLG